MKGLGGRGGKLGGNAYLIDHRCFGLRTERVIGGIRMTF